MSEVQGREGHSRSHCWDTAALCCGENNAAGVCVCVCVCMCVGVQVCVWSHSGIKWFPK